MVAGPAEQQPEQRELPPVTQSREELMALPVKELKGMLKDRGIDITGKALLLLPLLMEQCARMASFLAAA